MPDLLTVSIDNAVMADNETLGAKLQDLAYGALAIQAFTGGSVQEVGASVASVALAWSYSRPVVSQAIDQGVPALSLADRAKTASGPFTTDRTWTLTASDGDVTRQATTALLFKRRRYTGVSALASLSNGDILNLAAKPFADARAYSGAYNCAGGRYIYHAWPQALGALGGLAVGGLAFSDVTVSAVTVTNDSGAAASYYLARLNRLQTGSNIKVDWS